MLTLLKEEPFLYGILIREKMLLYLLLQAMDYRLMFFVTFHGCVYQRLPLKFNQI